MPAKWVSDNILKKHIRLGEIEIPKNADGTEKYTFSHLKHPLDSPWNLPDRDMRMWVTLPTDDELFKIAHYMDRNKSYRCRRPLLFLLCRLVYTSVFKVVCEAR